MKVAHVVENLKGGGGVPAVVATLAEQMAREGVDVSIVLLKDRVEYQIDPGVKLIHTPINGFSRQQWISRLTGKRLLGDFRYHYFFSAWFCRQLERQLCNYRFDCFYFHSLPVCQLMHRWQHPNSLFVLHSLKSEQLRHNSERETQRNYAIFARVLAGKRLIAVSAAAREDAIQAFHVDPNAITTVHNPFDLEKIRQQAQQSYPGPPEALQQGYLVFVGRLALLKRVDILLKAYQQSGIEEHLLILGRGEQQAALESLTHQLGLAAKVHFLGFIENPYPYMRRAKALVLSSAYEGLPTVLIEALACGTRVISTRVGGAEEILIGPLAEGLVDPGDIDQLVDKLRKVVHDDFPLADSTLLQRFDKVESTAKYLELARQVARVDY
jgi:glycosyltransferase involved in cell wall biosynthesis